MIIYVLGDFKSSPAKSVWMIWGGKVCNFKDKYIFLIKYQEDQVCNFKDLLLLLLLFIR